MRLALCTDGTRGDVYPMLALGDRLLAAGHEVRVCAPPDFQEAAEARGFEFRSVGVSVRELLTAQAGAITGRPWRMMREAGRYFASCVPEQFARLPEALADADWILGAGLSFAAPAVAERNATPYTYVAFCPVLLPSAQHPPFLMARASLPPALCKLAWRGSLALLRRLTGPAINRGRAGLGLAPVADPVRYLLGERTVMAADVDLAAVPDDVPFEVRQVPCLHPFEPQPLPAKLASFLDQGPPPIYVGFGSMTDPDPVATTRCVIQVAASLGCRVLLSEGWAGLGAGPLPEGVESVGVVDHAALFPRVAAVIHHGGAGTTTTAARAGVPQLVVPHVADQFYWAERVRQLGLGPPPLLRRRLNAADLRDSLEAILDNELLAERSQELGERLRARAAAETSLAPFIGSD